MALWNVKDLAAPPNQTYETTLHVVNTVRLATICREAVRILNDQKELHKEAAMLSRLLYRMKTKFRNDKGFKFMSKVNRGLLNYLSINLARIYSLLEPSPPELGTRTVLAPSRQMIEWVLLRTQGFASLMCNVAQNCEDAAFYMKCRIKLGHVWEIALLSLAIVSRIWTISKYLALCACEWYEELWSFLDVLKPVGVSWLPQGYQLPENLKTWLNSPILDMDTLPKLKRNIPDKRKEMDKIFTLIDVEDENDNAVEEESNDTHAKDITENLTYVNSAVTISKHQRHFSASLEDLGEPVKLQDVQLFEERNLNSNIEVNISSKKEKKRKFISGPVKQQNTQLLEERDVSSSIEVNILPKKKKKKFISEPVKQQNTQLREERDVSSSIEVNILPKKKKKKFISEPVKLEDTQLLEERDVNSSIGDNISTKKKKKNMLVSEPVKLQATQLFEEKGSTEVNVSSKKMKKKNSDKVSVQKQSTDSKLMHIKCLQSAVDVKKFLRREEKLRETGSVKHVTQGLDKLQWHMLTKALNDILKKLNKAENDTEEYQRLMKKARKELKLRIL